MSRERKLSMSRRQFLQSGLLAGAGLFFSAGPKGVTLWQRNGEGKPIAVKQIVPQLAGGTLDPTSIPKYQDPLIIPPAMPRTSKIAVKGGNKNIDYYEIAVRQFQQYILPQSMGKQTTVWSYGSLAAPGTVAQGGSFNYPAFTIEAKFGSPVRVRWINDLVDANGNYLPHLLPVDQTLHWANPPGGDDDRDKRGTDPTPYTGPVPMIPHLHGGHTSEESDGYPEAWFLPNANNIPGGYATTGTLHDYFETEAEAAYAATPYAGKGAPPGSTMWDPGTAVFQYPNDQDAATLWYHDHSLGMTRLNVYAGPAGFYLLRGGSSDMVMDNLGNPAVLPGPAPALGDAPGMSYYEIPIVIQDRSFNDDGSLFYPDNRAFFEELDPSQLLIPFIPDPACDGPSDVSPIWNPEFFGNTNVVNGRTWPVLDVEPRRYRFRFLNGSQSRFYILRMSDGTPFHQIGSDGGFLDAPVTLNQMLMGPAERADVIVDFTGVAPDTTIILENHGPDEPFGGGEPPGDFDRADPSTTGQVMQFRVVPLTAPDTSTPVQNLVLPVLAKPGAVTTTRQVSLNEEESKTVRVVEDESGNIVSACLNPEAEAFGPTAALLGTLNNNNTANPLLWSEPITENPGVGDVEMWEIYNFTADAHPIHIHLIQFLVVDRQPLATDAEGVSLQPAVIAGPARPPEVWERGPKDTVIAYPGEITRVKALFDKAGLFVWHCHILEHEDNEMMRPYHVGPIPTDLPINQE
jgi:spore coat protein A